MGDNFNLKKSFQFLYYHKNSRQAPVYIFFLFALIPFVHHFIGYFGHYGYDDLHYASIARDLLNGTVQYDYTFSYRFTIILLTSLSYLIFGISDFSSALPSLLVAVTTLFVVYVSTRNEGSLQTILALSLTIFISTFLFWSDKIMADIYVAFFLLLSIYWIDRFRFRTQSNHVKKYSFLFVFSMFLAFSSKETAVLFLPFPLALFFIDVWQKRNLQFWLFSIAFGFIILAVYLIIIKLLTGEFLKRLYLLALDNQEQIFAYSYDRQSILVLLKRISYQLFESFLMAGIAIPFIFILSVAFTRKFKEFFKVNDSYSLYLVASVVLLISLNFMTISPFSYHPVPTDPRHSIFIIPIASIAASYILKEFLYNRKMSIHITIFALLFAGWTFMANKYIFFNMYLPLTVILFGYEALRNLKPAKALFVVAFILILSFQHYSKIIYARFSVKYDLQKQIVFDYLINPGVRCYVFTDEMQVHLGNYFLGFNDHNHVVFVDYNNIEIDNYNPEYKRYLLLNFHTRFYSNTLNKLPLFANNIEKTYKMIFQDKKQGIYIYEIPDVYIPELRGIKLVETMNDFEREHDKWTSNIDLLTESPVFSGTMSSELAEFSPVYTFNPDSAFTETFRKFLLRINFQSFFYAKTAAKFVVSIGNNDSLYFGRGKKCNHRYNTSKAGMKSASSNIMNQKYFSPIRS